MYPDLIFHPSPNFNSRPIGQTINILLIHYTGMQNGSVALDRMCDPQSKVSAHYMIEENGDIFALVEEKNRAWHAGIGGWQNEDNINNCSIGIELVNPGHKFGYRPFQEKQMISLINLAKKILARHPIPPRHVLGHSDIAPLRKEDPGELFDWKRLADNGIGLYPDDTFIHKDKNLYEWKNDIYQLKCNLRKFGYILGINSIYDDELKAVITAFQRHFHPHICDGLWNEECQNKLINLLMQIN
ncbi:MAG: N-acetylmuramoyl-L-alanine amidase [Alphaproteobacteria bacterium]|nr:N-acetylmuramoyl-L-alanine amidase [Alphaproteobacteria bacterium]